MRNTLPLRERSAVPEMPASGLPRCIRASSSRNGRSPLPQHDQIERPKLEHELRAESGFHASCDENGARGKTLRVVCELQVESERHAGGRDANDIPRTGQQLALQGALWRLAHAIGIEDAHVRACLLEHPARRQTPSGGARNVYSPQCGSYGPISRIRGGPDTG